MKQLKKRQKARYEKEVNAILGKYAKLLSHHIGTNFLRFANEVYDLNYKYFHKEDEPKNKKPTG